MLPLITTLAILLAPGTRVELQEVPFTEVKINDAFWAPRRETNRTVSIPYSFRMLEKAGNLKNFELAATGKHTGYSGPVFMDSDLYKAFESASYSLATHPDPKLDQLMDGYIAKVAAAQMPDGYLNTHYQVNEIQNRFTNLSWNHELYCAGHLFEAASAHFRATGKRNLLNIATKYADLLVRTFGNGPGQRMGYCGHPEVELALIKLAKATGESKYMNLAQFFLENRGTHFFAREQHVPDDKYDGTYYQDDVPIYDHNSIKGHAVRAGYLMSGVTDLVRENHDPRMDRMLDRVWKSTTQRNMYVTGGIGPSASNEGFTVDYDLPNESAYQETCASVAMVMWNHRMGLLRADSKYWDTVERTLYNGFLAGVSLSGDHFFYVNPLASTGGHHRSEWFGCACCPPNVTRTLASLGQYAYAKSADSIYVNLYIQGSVETQVGAQKVGLKVTTSYPWQGRVVVEPTRTLSTPVSLSLRIPDWCSEATATIDGQSIPIRSGSGYLTVNRAWRKGDRIELSLPMPIQRVAANPKVKENAGRVALQRGPLVYCLEGTDQAAPLSDLILPVTQPLVAKYNPKLLGGLTVLTGTAAQVGSGEWEGGLYRPAPEPKNVAITAIPYYAWDNRKAGPMELWLPTAPAPILDAGPERTAKLALSYKSSNASADAIRDGKPVIKSNIHPGALTHFWPHKGGTEWVQYTWAKPREFVGSRIYWFDDTGVGECRLPKAWHLEAMVNGQWKRIETSASETALDKWSEVKFAGIKTNSIRLVIDQPDGFAVGIHEWQLTEEPED